MSNRALTLWIIDDEDPIQRLNGPLNNDLGAATTLLERVYPDNVVVPVAVTSLAVAMATDAPYAYAGSYGSVSVLASAAFATVRPSELTDTVAELAPTQSATLLHADPGSAVGAFARWEKGELRRSFSANPVDIYEDDGVPYIFESPFWGGDHPLRYQPGVTPEPLALPFHPAHLAEESNRSWLGFRFTPPAAAADIDPTRIPVAAFAIHPAGYEPAEDEQQSYTDNVIQAPVAPPMPVEPVEPPAPPVEPPTPSRGGRVKRYFGF